MPSAPHTPNPSCSGSVVTIMWVHLFPDVGILGGGSSEALVVQRLIDWGSPSVAAGSSSVSGEEAGRCRGWGSGVALWHCRPGWDPESAEAEGGPAAASVSGSRTPHRRTAEPRRQVPRFLDTAPGLARRVEPCGCGRGRGTQAGPLGPLRARHSLQVGPYSRPSWPPAPHPSPAPGHLPGELRADPPPPGPDPPLPGPGLGHTARPSSLPPGR